MDVVWVGVLLQKVKILNENFIGSNGNTTYIVDKPNQKYRDM